MTVRQLMLMGMLAVGVAGCPAPLGTCEQDSDCEGGVCDPTCNCCLYPPEDSCSPACQPWEQCNVGTCEARYTGIEISSHSNGAHVKLGAPVPVAAKPILGTGKTESGKAPVRLKVTAPGGVVTEHAMTWNEDAYVAPVTFSEPGEYQAVATVGGLSSAAVTLVTDTVGPTLNVKIGQAPSRAGAPAGTSWTDTETDYATAWRRDETATVFVSSPDADVQTSKVEVSVSIAGGEAKKYSVTVGSGCEGTPAWCGVAQIPLWEPEMKAFRGDFLVTATGQDTAGNESVGSATDTAQVTRWKWTYQVEDDVQTLGAPAITPAGHVVFGTTITLTTGSVVSVKPDGTRAWKNAIGAVTASVSVGDTMDGKQPVFVVATAKTGEAEMIALDAVDNGVSLVSSRCLPISNGSVQSAAVGIVKTRSATDDLPTDTGTAIINSHVVSIRPLSDGKCVPGGETSVSAGADSTIVGRGTDIWFSDSQGRVRAFTFSSVWIPKVGWGPTTQYWSKSLALTGDKLVGGTGADKGGLFSLSLSSGQNGAWKSTIKSPSWHPVVGSGDEGWIGVNGNELFRTVIGSSVPPAPIETDQEMQAAPLLGENNWLYSAETGAASGNGFVSARQQTDPQEPVWSISGLGVLTNAPNIDCPRTANGAVVPGQHGVLYVLNTTGKLYAFIVDSRGIDTTAPWPKYQHDPRNTGNADTDLSEFSCD